MNKQEAYKLARYAAEFYTTYGEDFMSMVEQDYRRVIDYLYDNDYEIVKKDESTIETTVG